MTRRATVLAGLLALTLCPSSFAGTYEVRACADAPNAANHSWTASTSSEKHLEIGTACGQADAYGGLYVRDRLACEVDCSYPVVGTSARWRFETAPGTQISALSYVRWLTKVDDDDWEVALKTLSGQVLETCSITYPASTCEVGERGGARASVVVPPTPALEFGLLCKTNPYGQCTQGTTLHDVSAVIYGATVTLTDDGQPSVAVTGGSLFDPGYVGGSRGVLFDASDNVGIRSARLYVDGVARPAVTYSCDFTYTVPCSDRPNGTLQVDTSTLGDGVHQVEIAVTDAAGNETRSAARTITVDNDAPAAPVGLSITSQAGDTFDVAWTNPPGQVAPIVAAHWQLCDPTGIQCTPGEQRGAGVDQITGIRVPGIGEWQLRVALEDEAGHYLQQNTAGITLRYAPPAAGDAPAADTSTDTPAAPTVEPPAPAPDPLTVPGTPMTPFLAVPAALPKPGLRVTSYRLVRGRIVIRGGSAAGVVTARFRIGRRLVTARRKLPGGAFVLRIRARRLPRLLTLRHLGSATHLPQTVRVRRRA